MDDYTPPIGWKKGLIRIKKDITYTSLDGKLKKAASKGDRLLANVMPKKERIGGIFAHIFVPGGVVGVMEYEAEDIEVPGYFSGGK